MPTLTINNKQLTVDEGTTVLDAAKIAGVTIPTLCHHKDLTPHGGCRLCIVEVKGARTPLTACTIAASEGMKVLTDTDDILHGRKVILQLLLNNYYDSDISGNQDYENELLQWANHYDLDIPSLIRSEPKFEIDSDPNPFIRVDRNKCILCSRCIRACDEIQGRFVWSLENRGYDSIIQAGSGQDLLDARCESCGACAAYCPTGALSYKMSHEAPAADKTVKTTCTYCGVGCELVMHVKDNRIVKVEGNQDPNSVNGMHLCVKGRFGYDFVHHPERLQKPMVRKYLLNGGKKNLADEWVEVSWDKAYEIAASKLAETQKSFGSDSIGVLTSAKMSNEENYLANKLARQVIGTNNIDHCARLCHSSTVAGLATAFGSGAMTNSMDDIVENASSMLIIGSNTTENHPVFGTKIRHAAIHNGLQIVVADPRKIDIIEFAVLHLQQKPGTDIALINGLMHIILENDWQDKDFIDSRTEGFEDFVENIHRYTPELTSQITGISEENLHKAAEILALNKPMAVIWAMGITQHTTGTANVLTLANLQMLLGNMGVSGGGTNPLRGQNNVQGACDLGGLPNVYPGYQNVTVDENQTKFEKAWGVSLSNKIGMTVTEMLPEVLTGKTKALYIMAENPIMSDPDTNHTRKCLEATDLVILQEIFPTETSKYADILLPGVSFAEKDGTFTNTERRIQRIRKAVELPGEAKEDWVIISEMANHLIKMVERGFENTAPHFTWDYQKPSDIMDEINQLTPIYQGAKYERLDRGDVLQWPINDTTPNGTKNLHVDKFTRGKGKFLPTEHIPPEELPDEKYPFLLTTGRVLYHWHGGEMTRRADGLISVYGEARVEINPEDAEKMSIENGQKIQLSSRRGKITSTAWITDRVPAGIVFSNFHFPDASANELTIAALDPTAKIPEYKVCAIAINA